MFLLSQRMGALADRFGPRLFMGVGPLLAACGLLLYLRVDRDAAYLTEVLPALLVFSLGLSMTVAPLTATVLADADDSNAGIASGVNNALARWPACWPSPRSAIIVSGAITVDSFHRVMVISAVLRRAGRAARPARHRQPGARARVHRLPRRRAGGRAGAPGASA